jgi:hypothetical protein
MHPSEKKTPPVEKRGFQSRPGLEGRHHSQAFNAPSADRFLAIAGLPAEVGDTDKYKERRNIDERFDPLHSAIMRSVGAWFPGAGDLPGGVWQFVEGMVPAEGIEPPTFGLQNRCSTAELSRQINQPGESRAPLPANFYPAYIQAGVTIASRAIGFVVASEAVQRRCLAGQGK